MSLRSGLSYTGKVSHNGMGRAGEARLVTRGRRWAGPLWLVTEDRFGRVRCVPKRWIALA